MQSYNTRSQDSIIVSKLIYEPSTPTSGLGMQPEFRITGIPIGFRQSGKIRNPESGSQYVVPNNK